MRTLTFVLLLLCSNAFAKLSPEKIAEIEDLKLKAEQGDPVAQNNLGVAYFKGDGVPTDIEEGVKWYRKAAEQGAAEAQCNLGFTYLNGNENRNMHYSKSIRVDYKEAAVWFQKAAEQGYARAQYGLGCCYLRGFGGYRDKENDFHYNFKEALKWLNKAAEQNYLDAQLTLGNFYLEKRWDRNQEVRNLADPKEAAKWYLKAALQGNERGISAMGGLYGQGLGVPKDKEESYAFYYMIRENDQSAFRQLVILEKEMSDSEILAGRKRAQELKKEIAENIAKNK